MSNTGPHCEVPNMHYIRSAPAIKHKIYRTCFLISIFCYSLHLFHASGLFLYLMREWGNQIFFDVFKEFSGMKWIIILIDPFSLTFIYVLDIYGRMYHVYKIECIYDWKCNLLFQVCLDCFAKYLEWLRVTLQLACSLPNLQHKYSNHNFKIYWIS